MSDEPVENPPSPAAPATRRKRNNDTGARSSIALGLVALLAVAAIGLSAWALVRSFNGSETNYSDSQRADAKAKVCGAFDTVRRGVSRNTNLVAPGGEGDVTGNLAVAANARMALYNGGLYLLARLDPATPTELADEVRGFADNLMDIAAAATAGSQDADPDQTARLKEADAANTRIGELCA
ncbi:hypothetical protein QGN32_20275 [Mycolicibacterium sp. ND9-15]|uniref:hypothetical protein n=1 Tax=Mycolicibacterium sp. ND9-15 TaxID=3042320 RepID=UPI002DDA46D5|nr:hypothetical protein [Mycolicibacterium sp. ND9-15]WSE55711.1 hypothetical protein QGN32_20275 [Mycolicibacterium sp. ND9-15]